MNGIIDLFFALLFSSVAGGISLLTWLLVRKLVNTLLSLAEAEGTIHVGEGVKAAI